MKLESQVCSLELAQKLKELGVKQESLFYHCAGHIWFMTDFDGSRSDGARCRKGIFIEKQTVSAYTVAELGEMLKMGMHRSGMSADEKWVCSFMPLNSTRTDGKEDEYVEQEATTEADARAECLIYLLENSLITL